MQHVRPTASLLASVTDESEARLCAALGADIIDAKNPAAGALGALPLATIAAIRAATPANVPVSATIGDPMDDIDATALAVLHTAATGVDFVKVGLDGAAGRVLARLGRLELDGARLVGVLLADDGVDLALVAAAQDAGFAGLMLDTADKQRGALPDVVPRAVLGSFIEATRAHGMFAGLAGSLQASHVESLLELRPDVLGFRGGLCRQGARTDSIDAGAVRALRRIIPVRVSPPFGACRPARGDAMAAQTEGVA